VKKAIFLILCVFALFACESREDFPPKYNLTQPPKPAALQVDNPGGGTQYDLSWSISDPDGLVREYYIYLVTGLGPPDSIGTSQTTSFTWVSPISVSGLAFGVTSVTDQNLESDPAVANAP
jgi:hypothetical protein